MAPPRKGSCLTCRRVCVLGTHGRCPACNEKWNRKRERERSKTRDQPHYDNDWRKLSRHTIEAHVRQFGYVCPGYTKKCPGAHPATNPLTTDHIVPGSLAGGVRVMCRSCNSSLGAHYGNALRRNRTP